MVEFNKLFTHPQLLDTASILNCWSRKRKGVTTHFGEDNYLKLEWINEYEFNTNSSTILLLS